MDIRKDISFVLQKNDKNNMDIIKNTIKDLQKHNKDDVPIYLDKIKEYNKIKEKEADHDNEYLKYML